MRHKRRFASIVSTFSQAGQGATEYLVLLAVVLVIALVAIALLGFFPGTSSDAMLAESEIYWKSASPLALVEVGPAFERTETSNRVVSQFHIKVRNTGSSTVVITGITGRGTAIHSITMLNKELIGIWTLHLRLARRPAPPIGAEDRATTGSGSGMRRTRISRQPSTAPRTTATGRAADTLL